MYQADNDSFELACHPKMLGPLSRLAENLRFAKSVKLQKMILKLAGPKVGNEVMNPHHNYV